MKKLGVIVAVLLLAPTGLLAASYPTKPITVVVPWPAGGGTDVVHRTGAQFAKKYLPVPVVIVNRPGAAGVIGTLEVERAKPDGYTVAGGVSTVLATQYTKKENPNAWSKLQAVAMLTEDPFVVAVRSDSKWSSLRDLLEYARTHPGEVKVGHAGVGAMHHLFGAALADEAKIRLHLVAYKGAAPAVVALLGGHVDAVTSDTSSVYAQVKSGQLRLLAIATERRFEKFKDAPTFKEQSVNLVLSLWRFVAVPKGTPKEVAAVLEDAYLKAARDPEFEKLEGGWRVTPLGAEETARIMARDDQIWKAIIDKLRLHGVE